MIFSIPSLNYNTYHVTAFPQMIWQELNHLLKVVYLQWPCEKWEYIRVWMSERMGKWKMNIWANEWDFNSVSYISVYILRIVHFSDAREGHLYILGHILVIIYQSTLPEYLVYGPYLIHHSRRHDTIWLLRHCPFFGQYGCKTDWYKVVRLNASFRSNTMLPVLAADGLTPMTWLCWHQIIQFWCSYT